MDVRQLVTAVDFSEPLEVLPAPDEARDIRVKAGVSVQNAGAAIGVSGATIARWEAGESVPRLYAGLRYRRLLAALSPRSTSAMVGGK